MDKSVVIPVIDYPPRAAAVSVVPLAVAVFPRSCGTGLTLGLVMHREFVGKEV